MMGTNERDGSRGGGNSEDIGKCLLSALPASAVVTKRQQEYVGICRQVRFPSGFIEKAITFFS
jgi:hypothetical protein